MDIKDDEERNGYYYKLWSTEIARCKELERANALLQANVTALEDEVAALTAALYEKEDEVVGLKCQVRAEWHDHMNTVRFYSKMMLDLIQEMNHDRAP